MKIGKINMSLKNTLNELKKKINVDNMTQQMNSVKDKAIVKKDEIAINENTSYRNVHTRCIQVINTILCYES